MSIYAGLSLTVLQTRLSEAQTALHELLTNHRPVAVGVGERRITYSEADAGELRKYISELATAIEIAQGRTGRQIAGVATWARSSDG